MRGGGLIGGIITLTALSLLLAGVVYFQRPLNVAPGNLGVQLVGADGHREVTEVDGRTVIREISHTTGAELLGSGPSGLAGIEGMLDRIGSPFARVTETRTGEGYLSRVLTVYELTDEGASKAATYSTSTSLYSPPPLELPADIEDGMTWNASGDLTRTVSLGTFTVGFTMEASASAPPDEALADEGCLLVTHTYTVEDLEDGDPAVTDTTATWCPDRGMVDGTPTELPGLDPDAELTGQVMLDPESWTEEPVDLMADQPLHWATTRPTVGTDDQLILAHSTSGDLIFAPAYTTSGAVRAHPGGDIVSLVRFGDLVVAGTTQARVLGYDLRGIPVWEFDAPDLVTVPPILHQGLLILMGGGGQLIAVDPFSGEEQWSRSLRVQATDRLLSCGEVLVVPTGGTELQAFDHAGESLWRTQLPEDPILLTCVGDALVADVGGTLELISLDGERVRSAVLSDSVMQEMYVHGEQLVTVSSSAVTRYDLPSLRFVSRLGEQLEASVLADGYLIGITSERLIVWDEHGQEVAEWPTSLAPTHLSVQLSVLDSGLFILAGDMRAARYR